MEKSKIQAVRDEFERLGCLRPFAIDEPLFSVMWNWGHIQVLGKRNMGFDYDVLMYLLADLPDAGGEDVFWAHVDNSDLNKIAMELWLRALRQDALDRTSDSPAPPSQGHQTKQPLAVALRELSSEQCAVPD